MGLFVTATSAKPERRRDRDGAQDCGTGGAMHPMDQPTDDSNDRADAFANCQLPVPGSRKN